MALEDELQANEDLYSQSNAGLITLMENQDSG
jgi:hypothetical protein